MGKPTPANLKSSRPLSANSNPYPAMAATTTSSNTLNYDFGDSNSKKRKAVDTDYNASLKTFEQHVRASSKSSGEINETFDDLKYHQMRIKKEEDMLREQLLAYNASRLVNKPPPQQQHQQHQPPQKKITALNLTPISSSATSSSMSGQHHPQHQSSGMKFNSNANTSNNKKPTIPTVGLPSSHSHLQQALSTSTSVSPAAKKMKISPGPSSQQQPRMERMAAKGGEDASSRSSVTQIFGTAVTEVVSNQLWICPSCNRHDESVPMIGCDSCDDWYHWYATIFVT
jgi:hypothetical protein